MMKKKTFYSPLISGLLLLTLQFIVLVGAFGLPIQYENTFLGELYAKVERLENTEGKRIVLIGGSAVAFGVDSALIEKHLPEYQVVNFGLYAALGTRIMLDLALPRLRAGDIVILSPEQNPQSLSLYFGPTEYWQAADGHLELLPDAPSELWPALASQLPYFAMSKWKNLLTGELPQPGEVYCRAVFNCYGDVDSAHCDKNVMSGGFDPNTMVQFEAGLVEDTFLDYCNSFADEAGKRGVQVYYRFPPMNALAVMGDVDAYADWLQEQMRFPLIGNPNATVLDAGWFYDTNFHLNIAGKVVNSRLLIRDIKAALGDPSPTVIQLPVMPNCAETEDYQGNDSDAVYFTGKIENGEAILTGLTGEGAAMAALTVPVHWNGALVRELNAGVFNGTTAIREITLQPNIRRIADRAFSGCPNLKTICLLSDDPGKCAVGHGLLDGANGDILVPEKALGTYRSHYTWAEYASRIKGLQATAG